MSSTEQNHHDFNHLTLTITADVHWTVLSAHIVINLHELVHFLQTVILVCYVVTYHL